MKGHTKSLSYSIQVVWILVFNVEFWHPDPTSVGTKAEANDKTRIGPFYNLKLFRNRRVNLKVQVLEKICMRGLQMTREFVSSGHLLQHIDNFINYRLSDSPSYFNLFLAIQSSQQMKKGRSLLICPKGPGELWNHQWLRSKWIEESSGRGTPLNLQSAAKLK